MMLLAPFLSGCQSAFEALPGGISDNKVELPEVFAGEEVAAAYRLSLILLLAILWKTDESRKQPSG